MNPIRPWIKHLANVLLVLAVGVSVGRTLLLAWDAPKPWMVWWGEFAYDASLAYFVGWLFNFFVIELPRRRERQILGNSIEERTKRTGQRTTEMLDWMWRQVYGKTRFDPRTQSFVDDAPGRYTVAEIEEILAKLDPNDSIGIVHVSGDGSLGKQSWVNYIFETATNLQSDAARLLPYLNHLDPEVVAASAKFEEISLVPIRMFMRLGGFSSENMEALTPLVAEMHQASTEFRAASGH